MSKILCLRPRLPDFEIIISDINTLQETYTDIFNVGSDLCQHLLLYFSSCIDDINAVVFAFKADYQKESVIAKDVEDLFQQFNIPFYCCSWNSLLVTATFLACMNEHGEPYFEDKIDFVYCLQSKIHTFNLVRSGRYYRIQSWTSSALNEICIINSMKAKTVFITILKEIPLNDISRQQALQQMIISILHRSKNLILINNSVHDFTTHAIVAFVPQLNIAFDKEKYALLQTCPRNYYFGSFPRLSHISPNKYSNDIMIDSLKESLISIRDFETVPIKKSLICYEKIYNARFAETSNNKILDNVDHGILDIGTKMTLSMDKFFMPHLEIIKREYSNGVQSGAIISLGWETFSVEVIKNGVVYDIDINHHPLMVGFFNKCISIGNEASGVYHEHKTSIITDLMDLLMIPLSQLKVNRHWGFTVARDHNDQTHVEFDTDFCRMSATPAYLLSLVLKWSIKKAEERLQQPLETLIISTRLLNEYLKQQIQASVQWGNLSIPKIQIHKYKIYEL